MKSGAVFLGALACAMVLYEYLDIRGRRHNRSKLLKRLHNPKDDKADSLQAASTGRHLAKAVHPEQVAPRKVSHEPGKAQQMLMRMLKGIPLVKRALQERELQKTQNGYRSELPKMLEIIALGMRVGLGFDQAFSLYVDGFSTPLALRCRERFEVWQRGLITREQGLRDLAKQIGLKEFDRFVSMSLRALRYGAPLASLLTSLASDARKSYRSERQEMVAKAPVKMLIPTGVFILPAMMMLVMGPIVLDITERMV